MKRILLTGMSGTGKTSIIRELSARGYKAVDADYGRLSRWINMQTGEPTSPPAEGGYAWDELDWVWDEERIQRLLSTEDAEVLFLAGTSPNQGKFYPQFDHIILLSAPVDVILERLANRENNPYGSTPRSRERVLEHIRTVEPLLRRGATHEIDTSGEVAEIVEKLLEIVGSL